MADVDLDKYLAEKQSLAQGGMRTPDPLNRAVGDVDLDKYLAEKTGSQEPSLWDKAKTVAGQASEFIQKSRGPMTAPLRAGLALVEPVQRGSQYIGGLVRSGYASQAGVATPEDLEATYRGEAPSTAQYLQKSGVPEGPAIDTPMGRLSARSAAGFVGDAITDPTSLAFMGAGGKVRGPGLVGKSAEKAGESVYKSAFKKVDERLLEKGKKPLSNVLLEEGAPTGTTKTIAKKVSELSEQTGQKRAGMYQQVTEGGSGVDLGHPLPKAEQVLKELRGKPTRKAKALADDLEEMMKDYKDQGKVNVDKLSEWKTDLYDDLPETAFAGGKLKGPAKRFQKALAEDFRQAIVDAGNFSKEGLGTAIDQTNEKWGSLLSSEKPLALQVRRGNTPNLGTSVDGILLGTGHAAAIPIKKGFDLSKTTFARTNAGKGLMKAGKSGLLDIGLLKALSRPRQGLVPTDMINYPLSEDQR